MKPIKLLPHKMQLLGWLLFILGIFYLIMLSINEDFLSIKVHVFKIFSENLNDPLQFFTISEQNLNYTIMSLLIVIGGLLISFSKEKFEDEFIQNIRLKSFQLAVLFNYIVVLFALLFIYDFSYIYFLILNLFTLLFVYIPTFKINLFKARKMYNDEE